MEFKLSDVRNKLEDIQKGKKESILFSYLKQLFIKKDYNDVEITHGTNEFGRDLFFSEYDIKLGKERYFAVVVKNKNASQSDFEQGGEIFRQIQSCFKHPFTKSNGEKVYASTVIVVINGTISDNALKVLSEEFHPSQLSNIERWNYQKLGNELFKHIPSIFLSTNQPDVDSFLEHQREEFLKFDGAEDIYHGLSVKDINSIYVNVRTNYNKLRDIKLTYTEYEKSRETKAIEEPDDSILVVQSSKSFVISGIATSGKSLMLKRIGYNSLTSYKNKPIAPFIIQLSKIGDCKKFNIQNVIEAYYHEVSNGAEFKPDNYSKVCLLLDGFDEVIGDESKQEVIKKIESFETEFRERYKNSSPHLQIILTTRDRNYLDKNEFLIKYERMELLPFDVGQAFQLVKKLIPDDKVKAEKFISAIKNNQLSNSLTRTPMALSLMAILYKEDEIELDELPANITELYNKFTDYYLNKWDTNKGISLQYKFEESKQILAFIAKHLHDNNITSIEYDDLKTFLKYLRDEYSYEDLRDLDKFLMALKDRVGIVHYSDDEQTFTFSHLAFQEYFVSISHDDSNEEELLGHFFNPWWSNTIVFYCGKQPKRDVFLKKADTNLIPTGIEQYYTYLTLLSRSVQASPFISNQSKKRLVERIIYSFNAFYQVILKQEKTQEHGMTHMISTLDLILSFRDFLKVLLSSKHLNQEQIEGIIADILKNHRAEFDDVPLYCLAYYATRTFGNPKYLEDFVKDEKLNVRWDRIVFVDLESLKHNIKFDDKIMRKLKKKAFKHKEYIRKQLTQTAYKHMEALFGK